MGSRLFVYHRGLWAVFILYRNNNSWWQSQEDKNLGEGSQQINLGQKYSRAITRNLLMGLGQKETIIGNAVELVKKLVVFER